MGRLPISHLGLQLQTAGTARWVHSLLIAHAQQISGRAFPPEPHASRATTTVAQLRSLGQLPTASGASSKMRRVVSRSLVPWRWGCQPGSLISSHALSNLMTTALWFSSIIRPATLSRVFLMAATVQVPSVLGNMQTLGCSPSFSWSLARRASRFEKLPKARVEHWGTIKFRWILAGSMLLVVAEDARWSIVEPSLLAGQTTVGVQPHTESSCEMLKRLASTGTPFPFSPSLTRGRPVQSILSLCR
mmetsp:Transcript_25478/g.45213  ORF Transcript_25478/g.45213 Transcript_25478/m.45213 type:complete len:246 (+) Transcript_25478:294-1031(+)